MGLDLVSHQKRYALLVMATAIARAHTPGVTAGTRLGDYVVGQPLWPLRIADAYAAVRHTAGAAPQPCTLLIIHKAVSAEPAVRDQVIAGVRLAASMPAHKHIVKTIAAGLTSDTLWVATEQWDGSCLRDVIAAKRDTGFGPARAGTIGRTLASVLAEHPHFALASESIIVNRQGHLRIADIALANGVMAATAAKLLTPLGCQAPESARATPSGEATDIYSIGALLFETLVGQPLQVGGPRPSAMRPTLSAQVDEMVARSCHRDPAKRFPSLATFANVIAQTVGDGAAMSELGAVKAALAPRLVAVAAPVRESTPHINAATLDAENASTRAASARDSKPVISAAATVIRDPALEKALNIAMADTSEKWLVTKGSMDYGPFSLADVVAQIDRGDIIASSVIIDKDSGAKATVGEHPLLGAMVAAAQQTINDARRAQAEVSAQSKAKLAGTALYATIVLGIAAVGTVLYFVVTSLTSKDEAKVAAVSTLGAGSVQVTVSLPKAPPKRVKTGGSGSRAGSSGGGNDNPANSSEDMSLDMSGDDEESSPPLDMSTVYKVYSRVGGQLGGCLQSNGERSANISMIIDGPSGKVNFVKVNGKTSGGLQGCLNRTLRSLKFPEAGSRTRAEFEIAM
jgi:eukaryotic-like serine/threonine-protein kinase